MHPEKAETAGLHPSMTFVVFLDFTCLVCGAMVMVLEILGSRVVGPFFGVSLFVWTSLIAVTLLGLSLGYAVGGFMADRKGSPAHLYGIVFLAGAAVLLIPVLKKPVLEATLVLGLRLGALTASCLLFGPALFLLGCVSPYIVKVTARQLSHFGRTVGLLYAVSTIGGLIGTVCTGFLLIAHFRVSGIFLFCGTGLIVLSTLYFLLFGKKYICVVLLAVPLLLPASGEVHTMLLGNGTRVTKTFEADTFYGNLRVLDFASADGKVREREMVVDGVSQGKVDLNNGMPLHDYFYYLQYIPFSLNAQGKNCLVIGLGPGILPAWYEKMGITTDVVDISQEVFAVAEKYFGFRSSGRCIVGDARYFLNTSKKKYDFVILEVFNGENTPSHLLSLESLRLISRHMNGGAILGINLIGSIRNDTFVISSIKKTLEKVFTTVEIFPTFKPDVHNRGIGNVEIIACNLPHLTLAKERLRAFQFSPREGRGFGRIGETFTLRPGTPAVVLTDDYNPSDFYNLDVKEQFRKWIIREYNLDMM